MELKLDEVIKILNYVENWSIDIDMIIDDLRYHFIVTDGKTYKIKYDELNNKFILNE